MISRATRRKFLVPILIVIQVIILTVGGCVYYILENDIELNPQDCKPIGSNNETEIGNKSTPAEAIGCRKHIAYSESVFFIMTAATTIGYGHEAPKSDDGKILTIFTIFLGVPFNLMLVAAIGGIYKMMINKLLKPIAKKVKNKKRFVLIQACFAIPIGKLLFLFLPALVFCEVEKWSYLDSFYFTFITMYTVGFGDFVATKDTKISENYLVLYKICVYAWIYLGIAYIGLLINLAVDYLSEKVEQKIIAVIPNNQYYLSDGRRNKALQHIIAIDDDDDDDDDKNRIVYLVRHIRRSEDVFYIDGCELKCSEDSSERM